MLSDKHSDTGCLPEERFGSALALLGKDKMIHSNCFHG